MKPYICYDSVRQKYSELRKAGMDKKKATMEIGKLVLRAYGIENADNTRQKT